MEASVRIYNSLKGNAPPFGKPDSYYMSRFPKKAPVGPTFRINKHGNIPAELVARNFINNLDARVAEKRASRIVYGGRGRAARTWFDAADILYRLSELKQGETLQVQSGAVSAILKFGNNGNTVQIANSNLIGSHDNQEHEKLLELLGLMMYGQYTAGSWIYIGTQGILQGTYYTFAEAGRKLFGTSNLSGKKILTAGCGAMSGAQGLAATLGGGTILIIEPRIEALKKRQQFKQLDVIVTAEEGLDKALRLIDEAARKGEALSVGFVGNAGTVYPELLSRKWIPDIVTEQTPAHDHYKYLPDQVTVEEADRLSGSENPADRKKYVVMAGDTLARQTNAMLEFQRQHAYVFDYGTGARRWAAEVGVSIRTESGTYAYPGFVEDLIRQGYFVDGCGPFRFIAYNGQSALRGFENALLREMRDDRHELMQNWLRLARTLKPQGTAARILWLNWEDRARAAELFHELVPQHGWIGIGRDHLDVGGAASTERCTEGLPGGGIADWVRLGAASAIMLGADVVAQHRAGGTGFGNSDTYGYTCFLTGTNDSIDRTRKVLLFDPAQGIGRLNAENVPGTADRIGKINAGGQMWFPPYYDRKGLVT
ncbi:MAG: urocanate hydratase [Candidatus Margulisiibacteriota bacterium]